MHSYSGNKSNLEQNFIDEGHKKTRTTGGMSMACARCRKLHIKCDGARPQCSQCRKKQAECEYVPPPSRSKQPTLPVVKSPEIGGEVDAMDWSSSSVSDSGFTPILTPLSPNYVDADFSDIASLQSFRNMYMLHQYPLEVREPLECLEAATSWNLAEQAFFWAALAFGARGSGEFQRGKEFMQKAETMVSQADEAGSTDEALLAAYLALQTLIKTVADSSQLRIAYEKSSAAIKRLESVRQSSVTLQSTLPPDSPRSEHDLRLYFVLSELMVADADWRNPEVTVERFQTSATCLRDTKDSSQHERSRVLAALFYPLARVAGIFSNALHNSASAGPGPIDEIRALFSSVAYHAESFTSMKLRYHLMQSACLGSLYAVAGDYQQAMTLQLQVLNSFFGLPLAYWDCFCTPLVFLAMQLLMRVDFARYRGSLDYLKAAQHDSLVVSNAIRRLEELEEDLELIQSLEEAEKLLPPRAGYSSALETSAFMKKDPRNL